MSVVTSTPEFVGREAAFAAMAEALDRPPVLATVEGEAGIGKTRFVQELLATRQDCVVLMAVCPPLREPFPLGPVVEGLRSLWPIDDEVQLSPLGGALRPLFPEWGDRLPVPLESLDDPRETRHRLFRALTELTERLNVEVLVVEDAHWADTATLEWLLTLVGGVPRSDDPGRSIVLTFRPDEVPDGSPLWRLTSRRPSTFDVVRLDLAPLDVAETRRLVASMLGADEVSERFATFLREHTDGLPLAIEECVRLLRDRHDIVERKGRWARRLLDELEVPPTLRDSVIERLERLDSDTRAVLHAAAILAEPADEPLLVAVADLDEATGRRGVAGGLAAGLLREARGPGGGGQLMFRHVLDARAVADAIPTSERWRLHRRAAKCLQELTPQPVARLARHFREAGDDDAWCRYAEASADLAWQSGDDRTAIVTLLQPMATIEHQAERRARLALKIGEAASQGASTLGHLNSKVLAGLRSVLAAADLPVAERGEIRLLLGRMLWRVGDWQVAFEEIEAAVVDLGDRPDLAARAMLTLAGPMEPDWPLSRHLTWLKRATALTTKVSTPLGRLALAVDRATTLLLLGDESGWEEARALPRVVTGSPQEQTILLAGYLNLAELATVWGRYGVARERSDAVVDEIQQSDHEWLTSDVGAVRIYLDWYTGEWKGLRERAAALAEADETEPPCRLRVRQIVGLLDLVSGARAAAERQLSQVVEDYGRHGAVEPVAMLSPAALGRMRLVDSSATEALRTTEPSVGIIARKGGWLWATDLIPVHLDALIRADRLSEATELTDAFGCGIEGRDAPAPEAALLLCRGILAAAQRDDHAALAMLTDAAVAWAVLPRPYDELLTLERQGHCLLVAGDVDAALTLLADVQERFRALGAKWDADRVAHLLRQHGVEVARPWRGGRRSYGNELSPRELEVVALVARGVSNPQVASELFLSPKTVERHVRSAMRKLGVSSRTALAMAAADAGLLGSDV